MNFISRTRARVGLLAAAAVAFAADVAHRMHESLFGFMSAQGLVLHAFGRTPNESDFAAYRVTNPGFAEIIQQPLYDYQLMPGTGSQLLTFFQTQIGQGVTTAPGGTVGSVKSYSDTNMQLSSQLPSGLEFLTQSIEVQFYPGSVSTANTFTTATITYFAAVAAASVGAQMNDSNTFYIGGLLEFNVLNKNYLRMTPLVNFVPTRSLDLSAAVASNSATTAQVGVGIVRPGGLPFDLDPPVTLLPACNFAVTISWPAVVALPSGFNARVGVVLQGYQKRAGQ
jgi:hypothetical protein